MESIKGKAVLFILSSAVLSFPSCSCDVVKMEEEIFQML
jgi:hypothetical protein